VRADTVTAADSPGIVDDRYVVISSDGHVGPSVKNDLRQYCEARHLADYDRYEAEMSAGSYNSSFGFAIPEDHLRRIAWHAQVPGLSDPHARLADMDGDGCAVDIIFHGGINGQSVPFSASGVGAWGSAGYRNLEGVGYHIYNRWLADYVATAPERFVGVAQISPWDVGAAVKEVEWAAAHGLKAVGIPAQRRDFPGLNDPVWEPLWSACDAAGLTLMTHAGAGDFPGYTGPESTALWLIELPFYGHRSLWHMIYGGVFERHPGLKYVLAEQFGDWIPEALRDMESVYYAPHSAEVRRTKLPNPPSYYWEQNCFVGASFMANFEAKLAIEHGFDHKMLWGSDYPHSEGTWPRTRLAMRKTYSDIESWRVARMLGGTALEVFHLDHDVVRAVASRIGPPVEEIATALDPDSEAPEFLGFAFREFGKYA
jgi:predicted TIM-barrel fold metal-dependent hydrolase